MTTNGTVVPGLFTVKSTGVSTAPVRDAAVAFLAAPHPSSASAPPSRSTTASGAWNNHRYARQGVSFKEMSEEQRARAFGLLKAALSAKGLEQSRNIMRPQRDHRRDDEAARGIWRRAL